jgi:hypothetical protein
MQRAGGPPQRGHHRIGTEVVRDDRAVPPGRAARGVHVHGGHDDFLGKESVDNILAFRFANGLFEPVWNREHICYVQIDVPETLSIEGRAAFYDATGA